MVRAGMRVGRQIKPPNRSEKKMTRIPGGVIFHDQKDIGLFFFLFTVDFSCRGGAVL
jgi:hypothetical protein